MKQKLLIVGAGLSGLYAASLLEETFDITILEARERIGGRIYSIEAHDMGPSWIWSHHVNMLSLLESLDLEIFPQYNKGYALYDTKDKLEMFNAPPSQPSFRVDGSLSLLVEKLYKNLNNTQVLFDEVAVRFEDLGETVQVQTSSSVYNAHRVIITTPPRLAADFEMKPALQAKDIQTLARTHTWMGQSAKCVIVCKSATWREKNLSGFVFSNQGPLGEIHDVSTSKEAALFGFVNTQADMRSFDADVRKQIKRVFNLEANEILDIHLVDWREEVYSSTQADSQGLREHPKYGIDITHFDKKLFFSATEFSHKEGGYLEGALIRAKEVAQDLKNQLT